MFEHLFAAVKWCQFVSGVRTTVEHICEFILHIYKYRSCSLLLYKHKFSSSVVYCYFQTTVISDTHRHACMLARMHTHTFSLSSKLLCMQAHSHLHACIHSVHTHTHHTHTSHIHNHARTHTCTHTHTHTCMNAQTHNNIFHYSDCCFRMASGHLRTSSHWPVWDSLLNHRR